MSGMKEFKRSSVPVT